MLDKENFLFINIKLYHKDEEGEYTGKEKFVPAIINKSAIVGIHKNYAGYPVINVGVDSYTVNIDYDELLILLFT